MVYDTTKRLAYRATPEVLSYSRYGWRIHEKPVIGADSLRDWIYASSATDSPRAHSVIRYLSSLPPIPSFRMCSEEDLNLHAFLKGTAFSGLRVLPISPPEHFCGQGGTRTHSVSSCQILSLVCLAIAPHAHLTYFFIIAGMYPPVKYFTLEPSSYLSLHPSG